MNSCYPALDAMDSNRMGLAQRDFQAPYKPVEYFKSSQNGPPEPLPKHHMHRLFSLHGKCQASQSRWQVKMLCPPLNGPGAGVWGSRQERTHAGLARRECCRGRCWGPFLFSGLPVAGAFGQRHRHRRHRGRQSSTTLI